MSAFDPTRTSPACRLSRLCRTAAILSYLSNALILQEPKSRQTERLVRSIRCKKPQKLRWARSCRWTVSWSLNSYRADGLGAAGPRTAVPWNF
jgi:hypothetical protein